MLTNSEMWNVDSQPIITDSTPNADIFPSETNVSLSNKTNSSSDSNIVGNVNESDPGHELPRREGSESQQDVSEVGDDDVTTGIEESSGITGGCFDSSMQSAPPEIQITSVPTVDQTASDYEPEETDPVATPIADISSSPPEPVTPTEEQPQPSPVEIVQSYYESTIGAVEKDEASEPDPNQDIQVEDVQSAALSESGVVETEVIKSSEEPSDIYQSMGAESFVMVDENDVAATSNSSADAKENSKCERSNSGSIRPSIELDESSTEHEYHVSPTTEPQV